MRLVDLTLDTPAENLALDEALLGWAEASAHPAEVLRLWESPAPFVVVGRSSQMSQEVDLEACARRGVAVLRRVSGGAAVVAGPGCLMYAVVLSLDARPELRLIDRAHAFVLGHNAAAIQSLGIEVRHAGTSDLVLPEAGAAADHFAGSGRKISGNSLRVKRNHLLYHGTLLYDFDCQLISECLRMPPRQPAYRDARPHAQFVTNLPLKAADMRSALAKSWQVNGPLEDLPLPELGRLVDEKYDQSAWNE